MNEEVVIRQVEQGDLPALTEIYNYYVGETPITFDLEPRTLAQRREWLDGFASAGRYQCLVAAKGDTAIGWACSTRFKERAAYETTVESSIYLTPDERGKGLGRRLYHALFEALGREDIHRIHGALPSPMKPPTGCTCISASSGSARYRKWAANSAAFGTSRPISGQPGPSPSLSQKPLL